MKNFPHHLNYHFPAASWEERTGEEIASELRLYAGAEQPTIEAMRSFLAVKACRELLARLGSARDGKYSFEALASIAQEMRAYGLDRPALAATTFIAPSTDRPEWVEAINQLRELMMEVFAECGVRGQAAERSLLVLRSLVRGFVFLEAADGFHDALSYEESYQHGVELFISGLQARNRGPKDQQKANILSRNLLR